MLVLLVLVLSLHFLLSSSDAAQAQCIALTCFDDAAAMMPWIGAPFGRSGSEQADSRGPKTIPCAHDKNRH